MTARRLATALLVATAVVGVAGACDDMSRQARVGPLRASAYFADGRGSRDLLPGTVARGAEIDTTTPERSPFPWTSEFVERGRDRYDVYCALCHDRAGTGGGMIVLRGFPRPQSLHTDAQRALSDARVHDVIADGVGTMPAFGARIPVRDRWAIVAYVRALQLSRRASLADATPEMRTRLTESPR